MCGSKCEELAETQAAKALANARRKGSLAILDAEKLAEKECALLVDILTDDDRKFTSSLRERHQNQAHWQQVEEFDIHPFPSGAGFSAQGYAGGAAKSYVFGGSVTLKGNCPLRNNLEPANALEYRFRIGEWTLPDDADDPVAMPTLAPSTMLPVTQIGATHVGYVQYTNAYGFVDSEKVIICADDPLPGGWIRLDNKAVRVDMRDGTSASVNINDANFLHTFDLLVLNTPAIAGRHQARLAAGLPLAQAGRQLAAAEREPIRRYRLSFDVRDAVTMAFVASDTLDSIVLDNSPVVLALDLEELAANAGKPMADGTVHVLYTINHPHLRFFRLSFSRNGGTVHPSPPLPGAAFPPPAGNDGFRGGAGGPRLPDNNGGVAVDVSGDPSSAYRVAVIWQTRHYKSSAHSMERLYAK
ncbi:hypothetical protein [Massilia glaciei]|uniref:Uncharacterized protein n=1 Tax=Massilia glaciei TaxID=1524097 RepID=A0A2U2HIF0_9BURK|nr:hypothetical protein [Massilia glaciei]PWF46068.1 hypothetical protein C7C56_016235 [Massilia glaciei]